MTLKWYTNLREVIEYIIVLSNKKEKKGLSTQFNKNKEI